MPSQFKQDNPGCDCCDPDCSCPDVTYFTISGLTSPDCGECAARNGTYIFRTLGSGSGTPTCIWAAPNNASNCGYDGVKNPWYFVGSQTPCFLNLDRWGIAFSVVSGKLRVEVSLAYAATQRDAFGSIVAGSLIGATFRADFDSCADAVGATLPLVSNSQSNCVSPLGDFCNLLGATVTLG